MLNLRLSQGQKGPRTSVRLPVRLQGVLLGELGAALIADQGLGARWGEKRDRVSAGTPKAPRRRDGAARRTAPPRTQRLAAPRPSQHSARRRASRQNKLIVVFIIKHQCVSLVL